MTGSRADITSQGEVRAMRERRGPERRFAALEARASAYFIHDSAPDRATQEKSQKNADFYYSKLQIWCATRAVGHVRLYTLTVHVGHVYVYMYSASPQINASPSLLTAASRMYLSRM